MPMKNVTLQEWLEIDRLARIAREAQDALNSRLDGLLLAHMHDMDVLNFVTAIQDRMADGMFISQSLQLQAEWLGGDSSEPKNHGLREPNAVVIAGHIPHCIPGSAGVNHLPLTPLSAAPKKGRKP